ncbi:MAG: LysR family transcriptional regulator [Deferrisomatales bacterium]|nr:LysR family transcriptional regulator [Deferrisomatales bacterium]
MSLRALRTLTVIARAGSFSAAAEHLGLTQAAVSHQMKGLEEGLGTELFDRTGRGTRLNPSGRLILERAEEILALYDGLRGELDPHGGVRGVLELGVIPTALTGPVPGVLARLRREHEEFQVRIRSGISDHLAPRVEGGELDAALISEPPYAVPPHCEWRPYDDEPFYVVGPPGTGGGDDRALFEQLPYVRFDKTAWTGALVEGHLMARGIHPRDVTELDSLEAVLSLVEQGLGVAAVPLRAARVERVRRRLTLIPLGSPQLRRRVGLYERSRHPRRPLTELLLDALRRECGFK